ncbi:uncharacterized protein BHQ10_002519 [Talaromyces amestolkiae]|uniref:Uncharacterized protein n=1 Tax=Talaromyces amestolkiae TaxID=1196081 RepID=A0A364KSI6_TALAM|nr:uncharacterized protein BHQ10_002519 [Talaromyces amestolkiae]RAO66507.1 hypothetical protein BHQ10_002519 [Talaromyces amestolkiae]
MEEIRSTSQAVKDTVTMIVKALLRGNLQLSRQLETLIDAAETCKNAAVKMDEELEIWNKYVMELHEACDATDQSTKSKYQIALSDEKARKVEQDLMNKSIADAEKWVKEREEQVKEMKDLVKEELKNYPTGNQLMVMDLVQTLGNAAASASNILAGAAASRIGRGAAFNINTKDASFSSGGDQGSEGDEAADEVANDPAATQLPFAVMAMEQLYGLVCDKTGVQWDLITNQDSTSGKGGQLDLSGVAGSLKRRRTYLEKNKNTKSSKVGKALLKSIGEAETVISELKVERTKSRNMGDTWKKPAKDSKQVTDWQAVVKKTKKDVQKLDTKNKALTSGTKNPPLPGANLQAAASTGSKTASQMAVETASFKVSTAREMYKSSLTSADTARTQLLSFQSQMNNIKADLDSLKEDKLTLEAVKLRLFFTKLSVQIKTLVSSNVIPFKGTVQDAISSPNALIDRMILQQYTVAIWAGFDQFKEIAEFYKSVHDPYIINGLNLVNKMTLQTNVAAGYKEIETYSQASQDAVKNLINAETEKFKTRIEKTYKEIMELEKTALPATEDEQNLIGSAVQNAEGVIKDQLDAKSGPVHYLVQPREKRDEQADKLSNALKPEILQQQADALADEGFFEQNSLEYLGLDD